MKATIKKTFRRICGMIREVGELEFDVYSSQAAFFTFVSLIPFCALMFGIIKLIPFADYEEVRRVVSSLPPIISDIILNVYENNGGYPAGAVIPISVFLTLWASSKGIFSVMRGIHSAYGEKKEKRKRDRIRAVLYTLVFITMIILSLVFVAFGNSIIDFLRPHLPQIKEITVIKEGIRLLLLTSFVSSVHLFLYMFSSDKRKKLHFVWTGSVFAGVGWTAVSYFYSLYLDYYISSGNTLYGDLAAVVFLLLWLYACMFTTLLGGFVNRRFTERISKKVQTA